MSLVELIPILYDPTKSELVVERPPTFTITPFCKFTDVDAIPTNDDPEFL